MRRRVLLADDHTLLLEAFEKLLEPEFTVVGAVSDGRALLSAAAELKPDVIVLDIAMPLLNGLDAARQLKISMPEVKLIFLTMNEDPNVASEAFRAGASGYLLKTSASSELIKAIKESLCGRTYVTPIITQGMVDSFIRRPVDDGETPQLTPRQREVLQLLAEGRSMKEAAKILDIMPRTVAFHKYRMMEQLNLKNFADLIQFALRECIVPMKSSF
ncbi:MAG: response regulator transcription factor [Alphaproteobacteria bacterium]|nr:response regulator transcription factor [Alphaproteobacteria bacterium]